MTMVAKQPQSTRILLVDDEADFRDIMEYSFKRMGYQVLCASNGKEAFDLIQKNPVDVVISDIRMPAGDGIELLDRTKAILPETPIILLVTGFADITTEEAHQKGAEALFSKPFDKKEIQDTITRLLTPAAERWAVISEKIADELKVELHFDGLPDAIDAKIVNIGRGGMFVTAKHARHPNVNDTVAFKIVFEKTKDSLAGNGVIRWIRTQETQSFPGGYGIEFTYLGDRERKLILDFTALKNPTAYIPSR